MPTVAELDVQIDADDSATPVIAALAALIHALSGEDVTIDVDTNAAAAASELAAVEEALQGINEQNQDVQVDLDAAGAMAELAALQRAMRGLEDEEIEARLDIGAALARLGELRTALDSVSDENVVVQLQVENALADIAALEARLKAIPDEKVTMEYDADRATVSIKELATQARGASSSLGAMTTAAFALGPALIPILGLAVAGIGAFAPALGAAGVGLLGFGFVAHSVFNEVMTANKRLTTLQQQYNQAVTDKQKTDALEKMKAVMESLSPPQQAMLTGIRDFSTAWNTFADSFEPQIFEMATIGLKGFAQLLPTVRPLIAGVADALLTLEQGVFRALASPFWQNFFAMLSRTGGPALESLGRSLGNIITMFAALIQAFVPMTNGLLAGLESLTAGWAQWAQGVSQTQGFRNFMDYIRTNGPLVAGMLVAMGHAFVDLIKAAAPIGTALVQAATKFFQLISRFQEAHPALASIVVALLGFGAVVLNLIGPIASIVAAIAAIGGVAALVVGGITLIVGAFVAAYVRFEEFRNIVNALAKAWWAFQTTVLGAFITVAQAIWTILWPALQAIGRFIGEEVSKAVAWFHEFEPQIRQVLTAIAAAIAVWAAFIRFVWSALWPAMAGAVKAAWTLISGIISAALQWIRGIITIFLGVVTGDWRTMWAGFGMTAGAAMIVIQAAIKAGLAIITGVWTAAWNLMPAPVRTFITTTVGILRGFVAAATGVITGFINVIKSIWNAFWAAVSSTTGIRLSGIRTTITTVINAIKATITIWINTIRGLWTVFWTTLQNLATTGINNVRSRVVTGINGILASIRSFIGSAVSSFTSGFSSIAAQAASGMSRLVSAVHSGVNNALSAIRSFASSAVGAIAGLAGRFFSAGASIMSSLASGIQSRVGAAVGAVSGAVSRLTALLPGSPAETGPLSGQGYALIRGQHFAQDLARGIMGGSRNVEQASRDLADMMTLRFNSAAAFAAMTRGGAAGTGGGGITLNISPGAVQVNIGPGTDPQAARAAFDGAGDRLAENLLTALQRR